MLQTIEVEIDANGRVIPWNCCRGCRVSLILLTPAGDETALLAEAALAEDWLKPEEDAAWAYSQPDKYSSCPSRSPT
jgi:hypothetical protein